ncbi:hypothetical protein B566_EDAN009564 [Ephemera danica]|nr:hypothetical protein B566_EDAN009564 [Ephemera danica]
MKIMSYGGGMLSTLLSRLCVSAPHCSLITSRCISTKQYPMMFRATPCLMAEPLKKKKRIDPAVIKQREERKKKKIERQIKRLEKNARQLKPIDEVEVPLKLIDERKIRTRKLPALSPEQQEERALLMKEWSRYRHAERLRDFQMIDRVVASQQKALDELRAESEELYQEAIQMDLKLLPYTAQGPVWTPPTPNYESPDGEYNDTTRKWD